MESGLLNAPRVNVAVVGVGYWGKNLVRNFHELGALVRALRRGAIRRDESAGRQYAGVRFFRDFNAPSSSDPSIDAVALATPAVTHYEMAKAALEAGKDVFVEKPLAIDVRHGESLVELAAAKGRILMVGHILRYHPADPEAAGADSGRRARQDQLPLLEPPEHRQDPDRGEHPLELCAARHLRHAVAARTKCRAASSCQGGAYLNHDVSDVTLSHFDFPSGVQAHIFVSWLHPVKEQRLVVVGSEKMAVFDDTAEHKLVLYPHRVEWKNRVPTAVKAEGEVVELDNREPLRAECQHFLDCVASRTSPVTRRRRRPARPARPRRLPARRCSNGGRGAGAAADAATREDAAVLRPRVRVRRRRAPRWARARRSGTSRTS